MSKPVAKPEGWGFPNAARRCHYFREGRSLCSRYGWWDRDNHLLERDQGVSPDDCASCRKVLDARPPLATAASTTTDD